MNGNNPIDDTIRSSAITLVIVHLNQREFEGRIAKLPKACREKLAIFIVDRNGPLDPNKNNSDAIREARENADKWRYCDKWGQIRKMWHRISGQQ